MQTWQLPNDPARERDRRLGGLRRLTMWAATGGVVGVGLFGAIGAVTIPGATTASTQPASTSTTTGSSSSSSSDSSGSTTVQAPVSAPTSSSSSSGGTTHAVSGGS